MRYPKVTNGIVIITEKVAKAATRTLATNANKTTKLRIMNLEIDRNTRREIPSSLYCMNPHISSLTKFGESFFKQFDLDMELRKEELKKQGKVEAEVSKVTKEDVAKTFGVTKDHMLEAAKILQAEENTKILGDTSAQLTCSLWARKLW